MDAKRAMEIRNNPRFEYVINGEELGKCIDEALEKDIPMKPAYRTANLINEDGSMDYFPVRTCPRCGGDLANLGYGIICPRPECRQRIVQEGDKI